MAGSCSNIELPTTADRLEDCPAATKPITPPLKSEREASILGSPVGEKICAICLEKTQQRCLTDGCPHQFCFPCLKEWCKIKSECPLCKKSIKKIKYNIKSDDVFDEYEIPRINSLDSSAPFPLRFGLSSAIPSASRPRLAHLLDEFESAFTQHSRRQPQVAHRLDFLVSEPQRYTYRTTLHLGRQQNEAIQQLFLRRSALTEQYRDRYPYDNIPIRQHTGEWRRYVYDRNLYALPLPDVTGRFRECNSIFYRENPAQVHRLLAWINRELVAILGSNDSLNTIMENMTDLLTIYNIDSYDFRLFMHGHLHERTDHFIHELVNYARSPFDLIGYDRNVVYEPQFENEDDTPRTSNVLEISSGSETDELIIEISEPNNNAPRTNPTETNTNNENNVIQVADNAEPDINNLSGEIEVQETHPEPQPGTSGINQNSNQTQTDNNDPVFCIKNGQIARTNDIVVSSDNDSDVEFVLARKPPHLRTPEMVSLNSESDSDVIFVDDSASKLPVVVDTESDSSDDVPLAKLKTEIKNHVDQESKTIVQNPVEDTALNQNELQSGSEFNQQLTMEPSTSFTGASCPRKKFYNKSIKQLYHEKRSYSSSSSTSYTSSSSPSSSSKSEESSSESDIDIQSNHNINRKTNQRKVGSKHKTSKSNEKAVDYKKAYHHLKKRMKRIQKTTYKKDTTNGDGIDMEAGTSRQNTADSGKSKSKSKRNEKRPRIKSVIIKKQNNKYDIKSHDSSSSNESVKGEYFNTDTESD